MSLAPCSKVLIANRGEVVSRVARTCRLLGLKTVAVFSEADAALPFVRDTDESELIGSAAAAHSYLDMAKIVAAAKKHNCDAIHPGWGFLSERADFADAVTAAGLLWIGPSASSIRQLGDKETAKNTARGLAPLIEGGGGRGSSDAELRAVAEQMGWPILLKAAGGGGGRGQRIVRSADEWSEALVGARNEAKNSFGDDALIVERYVERGRHVEVQVLGDCGGKVVSLGTRDCSVQRRRQKLIEEAPAWWLSDQQRADMERQAEKVCEKAGYTTAGTVEFLVDLDNGRHYFLEVNTRLQVEHTVTEEILGLDLVRLQILTARGARLKDLNLPNSSSVSGRHAMQLRVCAEDTALRPSTGRLAVVRWAQGGVRVEAGVEEGSEVGPHYDSMVAKLIVRGETRSDCIARAAAAACESRLVGEVAVNLETLLQVLRSKEFLSNTHTTTWLQPGSEEEPEPEQAVLEALAGHAYARREHPAGAYRNVKKKSEGTASRLVLRLQGGALLRLQHDGSGGGAELRTGDGKLVGKVAASLGSSLWRGSDGRTVETGEWRRKRDGATMLWAAVRGEARVFRAEKADRREWHRGTLADPDEEAADERGAGGGGYVTSMPATVLGCSLAEGAEAKKGATLLVLESMKMEIKIRAHADGIVSYLVKPGQQVQEGTRLLILKTTNK